MTIVRFICSPALERAGACGIGGGPFPGVDLSVCNTVPELAVVEQTDPCVSSVRTRPEQVLYVLGARNGRQVIVVFSAVLLSISPGHDIIDKVVLTSFTIRTVNDINP